MFMLPIDHHKQTARHRFTDLHRWGMVGTVWSMVSGRQQQLMHLDAISQNAQIRSRSDIGMQIVAIDAIVGSESRPNDFDRNWRPLKSSNEERWINIAVARINDVSLPAVELIKIGEGYFVRDGHHRISVAKHQGQEALEANVTEWDLALAEDAPLAMASYPVDGSAGQTRQSVVWEKLASGIQQISTQFSTLQQELMNRTTRVFNRPQNPFKSGTAA